MILKKTLLVAPLLIAASIANAQESAPRTILGIDISGSSTFLYDRHSGDVAGSYVQALISRLDAPHQLIMVSVGDVGLGRRQIDVRATITESRASNAATLSQQFGGYFRSMPDLVADGAITAQSTTSIIACFRSRTRVCAEGETTVILFSDGVEWSAAVDGQAFVDGTVDLPIPDQAFLSGCRIEMQGVGQLKATLNSDGLEERLIPQWEAFLNAAGADSVLVTGSFFNF
jgi:hypothetical protein